MTRRYSRGRSAAAGARWQQHNARALYTVRRRGLFCFGEAHGACATVRRAGAGPSHAERVLALVRQHARASGEGEARKPRREGGQGHASKRKRKQRRRGGSRRPRRANGSTCAVLRRTCGPPASCTARAASRAQLRRGMLRGRSHPLGLGCAPRRGLAPCARLVRLRHRRAAQLVGHFRFCGCTRQLQTQRGAAPRGAARALPAPVWLAGLLVSSCALRDHVLR